MHMQSFSSALAGLLAAFAVSANAQCANNVAAYNPNIRTMSANNTWFIVPVPKAAVQTGLNQAFPLSNLTLLDVPTTDKTLFPNGFPAGTHPVLASIGLGSDIRMSALQIDGGLMSSQIYAPYVSYKGSKTPIAAPLNQYIAGQNGPLPNGLVPAVASPLLFAGAAIRLGQFVPLSTPYQAEGTSGEYSAEAKWVIVPNPVSGPGVYPEAVDFLFTKTSSSSKYTAKTFKTVINQPIFVPSGMCQRNTYYFTNATAQPFFANGQVTFGPGANGDNPLSSEIQKASPDGGSGVYQDVDGFGGCAQDVGNNPQDCEEAAREVDPVAL